MASAFSEILGCAPYLASGGLIGGRLGLAGARPSGRGGGALGTAGPTNDGGARACYLPIKIKPPAISASKGTTMWSWPRLMPNTPMSPTRIK